MTVRVPYYDNLCMYRCNPKHTGFYVSYTGHNQFYEGKTDNIVVSIQCQIHNYMLSLLPIKKEMIQLNIHMLLLMTILIKKTSSETMNTYYVIGHICNLMFRASIECYSYLLKYILLDIVT